MSGFRKIRRPIAIVLASLLSVSAADAGSHKPAFGGDFTFRKIAPPKKGVKKRITVQIEEQAPAQKEVAKVPSTAKPSGLEWFWDTVGWEIEAAKPGRFLQAIEHIATNPGGRKMPQPRLEDLRKIADAHGRDILLHTLDKKVSPALVLALISVESGGRVAAMSEKGAQGLMQLIPATAEWFGVTDSTDPAQNIRGGVAYLDWLMREFDGDAILALAGYNAGENAVKSHQGVPPFSETRAYVPKVLNAWQVARGLCLTPPELATDGCVFRTSG